MCSSTNVIISPYNGTITENRPNDASLLLLTGLPSKGFPTCKARICPVEGAEEEEEEK